MDGMDELNSPQLTGGGYVRKEVAIIPSGSFWVIFHAQNYSVVPSAHSSPFFPIFHNSIHSVI
jgi:hypothetical protein